MFDAKARLARRNRRGRHDARPKVLAMLSAVCACRPGLCRRCRCEAKPTSRKCKACHSIIAPDGTEIQKGGKTGPNLYGIVGRAVASDPDFKYGDSLHGRRRSRARSGTRPPWSTYIADPAGLAEAKSRAMMARSRR